MGNRDKRTKKKNMLLRKSMYTHTRGLCDEKKTNRAPIFHRYRAITSCDCYQNHAFHLRRQNGENCGPSSDSAPVAYRYVLIVSTSSSAVLNPSSTNKRTLTFHRDKTMKTMINEHKSSTCLLPSTYNKPGDAKSITHPARILQKPEYATPTPPPHPPVVHACGRWQQRPYKGAVQDKIG